LNILLIYKLLLRPLNYKLQSRVNLINYIIDSHVINYQPTLQIALCHWATKAGSVHTRWRRTFCCSDDWSWS